MADSSYLAQLTEAEVKSNRIISAAHEARDKRIKEAKFDAEQEIAQQRQSQEESYLKAKDDQEHGAVTDEEYSPEATQSKIGVQQTRFDEHKDGMIEFLIENTLKVNLSVPAVVIGKFDS